MKGLTSYITIILFAVSFCGFAQKVKLKDNVVLIDGAEWLKYNECGSFDSTCSLLSAEADELVFMKWISIDGAEPVTRANSTGTLRYVEIVFLGKDAKIEIKKSQKDIIAMLYNAKIVTGDGQLDEEKVSRLVEKYGTPFSDRLNKQNSTQTIIIKEEPKKSGININIGG